MTLSGTKVEGFTEFDKNLDKIVVGKINKIEKHLTQTNSLFVQVQVDEDGTQVQIVTGASNVAEGQKYRLFLMEDMSQGSHKDGESENGFKIKKGKLRGVESFGMMCVLLRNLVQQRICILMLQKTDLHFK